MLYYISFGSFEKMRVMQLSKGHINKFKEIYKKQFGMEISNEEATEKGIKLIRLLMVVDKPLSERDYNDAKTMIRYLNQVP